MRINPINSSNSIPFLKKKQPIVVQEEVIKMVPDEEADEKDIIPKLRCVVIRQIGVVKGEGNTFNGSEEKRLDRGQGFYV